MKIACLGWGSLIWNPEGLPIQHGWLKDGPLAPIEFSRQSLNGRLTLVIDPVAAPVKLLWSPMTLTNMTAAMEALRNREGLTSKQWILQIGVWQVGNPVPDHILDLPAWATSRGIEGVIWTALGPKFNNQPRRPSGAEVISYLKTLEGKSLDCAREYIERAPRQIDTEYRRQIEELLGWSCVEK